MTSFIACNIMLALLICTRCEKFIREVKETKNLCIAVMSVHLDDGK